MICDGPGDGSRCSDCVAAHDAEGHRRRLSEIRTLAARGLDSILAVLVDAWRRAFAGRADVTLVLKDFAAGTMYLNADRRVFRELAASGGSPRIELIEDNLEPRELAALYRSCDVFVHPYRGEGFAMPVLEAMACGLPVIVTGCPPTNEFCPPEAGWRIRAHLAFFAEDRIDTLVTVGRPWVAEPDADHLVELLRAAAAAGPRELAARGRAGREAALQLSWDAVADRYRKRLTALAASSPRLASPGGRVPVRTPPTTSDPVTLRRDWSRLAGEPSPDPLEPRHGTARSRPPA